MFYQGSSWASLSRVALGGERLPCPLESEKAEPPIREVLPFVPSGSPNWSIGRTFRATFTFSNTLKRTSKSSQTPRAYRNPICVAREWKAALESGTYSCAADLTCSLGVSRARVSQMLRLLRLCPEVQECIVALGDPLPSRIITERALRPMVALPAQGQKQGVEVLLAESIDEGRHCGPMTWYRFLGAARRETLEGSEDGESGRKLGPLRRTN